MMGSTIDALAGFGIGHEYAESLNKEVEIKQGENYYLSTLWQSEQIMSLGSLFEKIITHYPNSSLNLPVKVFANVVPVALIPFGLLAASAKHEQYEAIATRLNAKWNKSRFSRIPLRFPTKLSNQSLTILSFLAENTGKLANVAMIVSSVALFAIGSRLFGAVVLATLAYSALDRGGYIPRKISLFMETYMPVISLVGLFLGGSYLAKVYSLATLASYIPGSAQSIIHEKIDSFSRKFLFTDSVSLKELDQPITVNKDLSIEQIYEILNTDNDDFMINPAHSSKAIKSLADYSTNDNFELYLTLFDKVKWTEKYALIRNRLLDDEIFLASFKKNDFPDVKLHILKKDFDHYMALAATQKGITVEKFAADWLRKQMAITVEVLKGDRRVKGSQKDLEDTINNFSKILPHLESLDRDGEKVELEDTLLKIAVEGGDYCARGLKRVSNEIVTSILTKGLKTHKIDPDPLKDYEIRIERTLLEMRIKIMQAMYKLMMSLGKIPNAVADDVHSFDVYRIALSLGFTPLTEYERKSIDFSQLSVWITYKVIREWMYNQYKDQLDEAIEENGEVNFANYIRLAIENNPKLTNEQKEGIIEVYTERNDGLWTVEETNKIFHRLLFVMLGILTILPVDSDAEVRLWFPLATWKK